MQYPIMPANPTREQFTANFHPHCSYPPCDKCGQPVTIVTVGKFSNDSGEIDCPHCHTHIRWFYHEGRDEELGEYFGSWVTEVIINYD